MNSKMEDFAKQQNKQKSQKREGDVTIDYSSDKTSKQKPIKGEYVDYVEVKD